MKRHTLPALAAALCLLCAPMPEMAASLEISTVSAADETLTFGDLTYTIENDEVIITGFDETKTTVEIPDKIDGMPVTKIGPTAFYGCIFTEVAVPEGVTSIGSGAFWHCKSLKKVTLPSTLTTIEGNAFNDCTVLDTIQFPKSLSYIGANAFVDTAWLTAQREKSPFVIVNGILIDAQQAVDDRNAEITAIKEQEIEELNESKIWHRSAVITNQVGYFADGAKRATFVTDSKKAVEFSLVDEAGEVKFVGESIPFGSDKESGDTVHIIDFTEFNTPGTYQILTKDGASSKLFKIGITSEYSGLWTDAMNYFYQNRSGMEIEEAYITSGNKTELARAAGHAPDTAHIQWVWDYEGTSGEQDVTGGWYDAGDHGKYVVNGGISLWLMQNEYERAALIGKADAYQDGTMSIPENSNGFPDLLDEARYEMEWMLTMIVQDGDYKGMAYHKVHDDKWTAIGTAPANDKQKRYLMPPSTAATLNLAACGAQSYRLWKELDPEFAQTCLDSAVEAYKAAQAHPDVYAPNKEYGGGGAYADSDVSDEFYWAACELFEATGDAAYLDDAKALGDGKLAQSILLEDKTGAFDWGNTRALGSLTLSLYPDSIDADDTACVTTSIIDAANVFTAYSGEQGYGLPYHGAEDKNGYSYYAWGSNSFIADNAIILAYAYDFSGQQIYLDGVTAAMDYILGRNPLDFSYVTGYGEHSAQYPHHRFWAKAEKKTAPKAPCGVLTGGANNNMQDDVMTASDLVAGETPAQLCHIDNIQAYSVNECAVNWNSPLAWVTAYLCEQNGGLEPNAPSAGKQVPEPPTAAEIQEREYPVSITIPEGVTAVGEQVFGKPKSSVTEVIVPDSVTNIYKDAFSGCTKLTDLTIPETISEVGDNAFADTPWLSEMLADSPLLVLNGILIDGSTSKGDVVVPDGVTSILGGAFKQNKEITSITIPEGVTSIGAGAFHSCEALTSVSLPQSLKTIGESAFAASGLTTLTIPAGVKSIGEEAFINCLSLPEVTVLTTDAVVSREALGCTSTFTANGQYSYIFIHGVNEEFIVNCAEGSTAAAYAGATGVQVNYIDVAAPVISETKLGDCNGDKAIDIMDVIAVNRYLLGGATFTDSQKKAADVDGSGKVDTTDSLNILKYVVELISDFTEI